MLPDLSWLMNPQMERILALIVIIIHESDDEMGCISLMEEKQRMLLAEFA